MLKKKTRGKTTAMKMSALAFFCCCLSFCIYARDANGQVKKISLSLKQQEIKKVISEIEKAADVKFIYSPELIDASRKVDVEVKNKELMQVLSDLFTPIHIRFELKQRYIILSRREDDSRADPGQPATPAPLAAGAAAQATITVTGTITAAAGTPLAGVSVQQKGGTAGASSNSEGKYSIHLPDEQQVLVFSHVGYETQEEPVKGRRTINITLREAAASLNDVVVVAYGTQKKVNLTGAVSSVSAQELTKRPGANPLVMLQGKVPGLQIVQNSGQPGLDKSSIQIRGQGTFSAAGNNPLVLIDGIEGSLSNLNPNMIESISVLKDASSSAIYGARAANGVILVTTKQGREGRLSVEYGYNLGIQKATSLPELVNNSVEYMQMVNAAIDHTGNGKEKKYSDRIIEEYRQGQLTNPERYPNTNWEKIMFHTALAHQHYLNVSGGKGGTVFNMGMGIYDQDGIMRQTDYRKYDATLNFRSKLGSRVSFGSNINFTNNNRHQPNGGTQDVILSTYAQHPLWAPRLWDGSGRWTAKAYNFETSNKNPVAVSDLGGQFDKNYYALATAYMDIDVLKNLKAQVKGSVKYDYTQTKNHSVSVASFLFQPDTTTGVFPVPGENFNGSEHTLTVNNSTNLQTTLYATLNWNKTIRDVHNITVLGGYSQEYFRNDQLQGFRTGFSNADLEELDAGPTNRQTTGGNAYEWAIQSVFGRLNYNYKSKYLFEFSFRDDGSSRFARGRRWGFFPSMSAGWRISQENFLASSRWINELKLRGSWGQLGNQNIGNYPYQKVLGFTYYDFNGLQQGVAQTALNNDDITWETTTMTDIGLDFTLLKGTVYGSVDVYSKFTKNILRSFQVPAFVGMDPPTVNKGEMKNTGLELTAGYKNSIGAFRYSVGVNVETYKNKVVRYGDRQISSQRINQEGLPYGSYYMLQYTGVFQSQDEISKAPKQQFTPKPGDLRYTDINGDNVVDAKDRMVIGGAFPKFNYGFNLNMEYKGFDLSVFFQGVEGRKVYVSEWGIAPFRQYSRPPVFWRDAWTPENHSNTIPAIYNDQYNPNTQVSDWWLRDASYLRLKNLQFGYQLSPGMLKRLHLQNLRLYFSGDNLLTFTHFFKGGDPERVDEGRFAIYPQATVYTFGIKATF